MSRRDRLKSPLDFIASRNSVPCDESRSIPEIKLDTVAGHFDNYGDYVTGVSTHLPSALGHRLTRSPIS
jgi:hypothetical protein